MRRRQGGFSLLEVMAAVVVLAVAGSSMASNVLMSAAARDGADDYATAVEAARGAADRLAATRSVEAYLRFGPGGTVGPTFDVPGLPGKAQGLFTILIDETATDADIGMSFGMPCDLDGDGKATTIDVSLTAKVLPAFVEVKWARPGRDEQRYRLPVIITR